MARAIGSAHQFQTELFDARLGERQADQPASVRRHEIDRIGRCHLGWDDQVPLILAILVVDEDEHPAIARFLNDLLDRDERRAVVVRKQEGLQLAQRFRGRIPVGIFKVAQRVGVKPRGAREAGAGHATFGDKAAEFVDQLRAHATMFHITM